METTSRQPTLYAGQAPPDKAFYASTFKNDQMGRQDLVRGLHINNVIAREIDDFIDDKLREESPHAQKNKSSDEETSHEATPSMSRPARYFELDLGKSTHWIFDGIYTSLVDKFECFQTAWRMERRIPWGWLGSAVHIWVRNNRQTMSNDARLQDMLGGYKRRYTEERVFTIGPTKRKKRGPRKTKLIDCKLAITLCHRTGPDSGDGFEKSVSDTRNKETILIDRSRKQVFIPTWRLIPNFAGPMETQPACYLDNGDIDPSFLSFDKLLQECTKLGDAGEGSIVAYGKDEKITRIRNSSALCKAVRFLRDGHETEHLLELIFVEAAEEQEESEVILSLVEVKEEDAIGLEEVEEVKVKGEEEPADKENVHPEVLDASESSGPIKQEYIELDWDFEW